MRGLYFASPREAGGGGPCAAWWRGNFAGLADYPSTTLRVVPLPICNGEE
jgi:hypothetical protein